MNWLNDPMGMFNKLDKDAKKVYVGCAVTIVVFGAFAAYKWMNADKPSEITTSEEKTTTTTTTTITTSPLIPITTTTTTKPLIVQTTRTTTESEKTEVVSSTSTSSSTETAAVTATEVTTEPTTVTPEVVQSNEEKHKEAQTLADNASQDYRNKKHNEAIAGFTKAIELDSSKFQYYTNRGMAYFSNSKYTDAYDDATKSLALESTAKGNLLHAIACYRLNLYEESKIGFEKALQFEDDSVTKQAQKWQGKLEKKMKMKKLKDEQELNQ